MKWHFERNIYRVSDCHLREENKHVTINKNYYLGFGKVEVSQTLQEEEFAKT